MPSKPYRSRYTLVLVAALVLTGWLLLPGGGTSRAAGALPSPDAKKICKTVGKGKKAHKVCHAAKPKPTPTPTPIPTGGGNISIGVDPSGASATKCSGGCAIDTGCLSPTTTAGRASAPGKPSTADTRPRRPPGEDATIAHTPGNRSAAIFVPFGYLDYFDGSVAQPMISALQAEGYSTAALGTDTLSNNPTLTVNNFFQAANAYNGVFAYVGHGSTDKMPIETYKSLTKATARYRALIKAGWTSAEIKETAAPNGTGVLRGLTPLTWVIAITPQAILDKWSGSGTFVFLVGCQLASFADAFLAKGARQVFAYPTIEDMKLDGSRDLQTFWTDLDGSGHPDANINDPRTRLTENAFADCVNAGGCSKAQLMPAGVTMSLAPAVKDIMPERDSSVPSTGAPVTVRVAFDTLMDLNVPATSVVQVDGCGAKPDTPLAWAGDVITGTFDLSQQGQLTITVMANQAHAAENGVPLDGDKNPDPGDAGPNGAVKPNGDDFVWHANCAPPTISRATFSASGTIYYHQDPLNGCKNPEDQTYTMQWTTTWTTDRQAPLPLTPGATLNTSPSQDPTLRASGMEQTTTCNGPPCSGSFSVGPGSAAFPTLTVLSANTSAKPQTWTIKVQFVVGGSGTVITGCPDGFGNAGGGSPDLTTIVTSTQVVLTASTTPSTQSHTDTFPVSVSRTTSSGSTTLTENWSGTVTVTGTY